MFTYSPLDVLVTLSGLYTVEGFSDSAMVSIVKDEAPFQYQKSMDGSISRLMKKDATYTITLSLNQTSPSNDILMAIHRVDLLTGLGKFPILIKDGSGTSFFFATNCWIENIPDLTFTSGIGSRDWVLKCSFGDATIGGNDKNLLNSVLGVGGALGSVLGEVGVL